MNRPTTSLSTSISTRLQSVASAFVVTLAMLGAINGIASHQTALATAAVAQSTTLEA